MSGNFPGGNFLEGNFSRTSENRRSSIIYKIQRKAPEFESLFK